MKIIDVEDGYVEITLKMCKHRDKDYFRYFVDRYKEGAVAELEIFKEVAGEEWAKKIQGG